MERRRGNPLDFRSPRDRALLAITDEQLAGLIGSAPARIVRGGPAAIDESYAAAAAYLSIFPLTEVVEANHRLEYVQEMLRRRLTYRPRKADVQAVNDTVAKRISDPALPQAYLVKCRVTRAASFRGRWPAGRRRHRHRPGRAERLQGFARRA